MAQLEPLKDEIAKFGASLVYIAAEKREGFFKPVEFLKKHPVSFPFLLDEDRQVTKMYGVYHRVGLDAWNIARPATFVIGGDEVIRYIHVGAHQLDRAPVADILNSLRTPK